MQKVDPLHSNHEGHEQCSDEVGHEKKPVHIFVNQLRFEQKDGVKPTMTIAEIAALVKIPPEIARVRRYHGHNCSEPLHGEIELVSGDRFSVTRKKVNGGFELGDRVGIELQRLKDGGQQVERLAAPENAVIFCGVPIPGKPTLPPVDVLVRIPPGYPAHMLDLVALPIESSLFGKVKGQPQQEFSCGGRRWRQVSYHPHMNGGAGPWDPNLHGFHTYFAEILSWLGDFV